MGNRGRGWKHRQTSVMFCLEMNVGVGGAGESGWPGGSPGLQGLGHRRKDETRGLPARTPEAPGITRKRSRQAPGSY